MISYHDFTIPYFSYEIFEDFLRVWLAQMLSPKINVLQILNRLRSFPGENITNRCTRRSIISTLIEGKQDFAENMENGI